MARHKQTYDAANEHELNAEVARLAPLFTAGMVVFLNGDLGAGKTTFVKALLAAKGYQGTVKSPTYTLVEPYSVAGIEVNHFDLYRIESADELEGIGIRDLIGPDTLCLFEWPQKAQGLLPQPDVTINLAYQEPGRRMTVEFNGA